MSTPGTYPRPHREAGEVDAGGEREAARHRSVCGPDAGPDTTHPPPTSTTITPPSNQSVDGAKPLSPTAVVSASFARSTAPVPAAAAVCEARPARRSTPSTTAFEEVLAVQRHERTERRRPRRAPPQEPRRRSRTSTVTQAIAVADRERHERLGTHRRRRTEEQATERRDLPTTAPGRDVEQADRTPCHQAEAERVFPDVEGVDRDRSRQPDRPERDPTAVGAETPRQRARRERSEHRAEHRKQQHRAGPPRR